MKHNKLIRKSLRESKSIKERPCTACGGSGYYDIKNSPKCSACGGTGKQQRS